VPPAPRQDRQPALRANLHRPNRILNRCRDHNPERLNLVQRRIGRVQHPVVKVEANLALDRRGQFARHRCQVRLTSNVKNRQARHRRRGL
jgi:hypothetical protein